MENKHCMFCTQFHNNNWIETETQQGYTCDICYKTWQDTYEKSCNICKHTLPIEEFVNEWGGGFELPEEMCSECAQEYIEG